MSKRRSRLAGQIARYRKNLCRKSRNGGVATPEEREAEARIARAAKRLDPAEFDELLQSDGLD